MQSAEKLFELLSRWAGRAGQIEPFCSCCWLLIGTPLRLT